MSRRLWPVSNCPGPGRAAPVMLIANSARLPAILLWEPRYDRLEAIIRHALAWEEKLAPLDREDHRKIR